VTEPPYRSPGSKREKIIYARQIFDSIGAVKFGIMLALKMSATNGNLPENERYSTGILVRRLLALAWQFRANCLWSMVLSLLLLLLGIAGLQLLGLVIDVIRQAQNPALPAPAFLLGWHPPAGWSALRVVTVLALAIVVQALFRAALTYKYNMVTARLTQGEIVPELRSQIYAKLQRLSAQWRK